MARKKIERNISYDEERKRYYVNLEFGRDPETGKQIKKTKTFVKLTEAKRALRKHEVERDQGRTVLPVQITVAQWLDDWLETVIKPNKAATTVYAYRHIMDHIVSVLGDIPLQKLTPQQIQKYYAQQISNGLSSNTVRKHHDLLNHALKVAVVQDVLAVNPVAKVTPPKFTKKEIHFYSPEKLKLLMSLAEGDRIEILIKLAAYLGLRREEILGLTWDNVDLDNRLIHIRQVRTAAGSTVVEKDPKTATSARDLYIPDEVVIALQRERERQEQYKEALGSEYQDLGYVFCHENDRPFRPNYVSDLFSKFIKDHELPHITLHGLRHSFATMANSLGIPMYDIGKALGHSTPATTSKVYTHLLEPTHEGTMKKIAEALNGKGGGQ